MHLELKLYKNIYTEMKKKVYWILLLQKPLDCLFFISMVCVKESKFFPIKGTEAKQILSCTP